MNETVREIENEYLKEGRGDFQVGDQVNVRVRITEGEKERVQTFSGVVIARKGSGARETFTVRRIVQGEGVERVFPLHSPSIVDIKVAQKTPVRRAKLYYLRDRRGRAAKLAERPGRRTGRAGTRKTRK